MVILLQYTDDRSGLDTSSVPNAESYEVTIPRAPLEDGDDDPSTPMTRADSPTGTRVVNPIAVSIDANNVVSLTLAAADRLLNGEDDVVVDYTKALFGDNESGVVQDNAGNDAAELMGLVVFTDCPTSDGDDFLSELMTQHILDQAMGTASPPPLSHSHLHQLLSAVSGVEVSLSPSCQQLLRSFYLASRRVRASSLHGTDMPVSGLDVMSVLAEAHARLSLRSEATEEDGVMAILLYEESLVGRYGHSVLSAIPAPHFRDTDLSAYLGKQFDQEMRTFHRRIVHFTKCHVTGTALAAHMPEE
jgi:hypothetical protein